MKILLLNQFFWPDLSATGQLLTDVAVELTEQGHDVSVICGTPSYAGLRQSHPPAVQVCYLRDYRFSKNRAARLFSYLSFWILCVWKALFSPRPDIIVTLTTPPLLALIGTLVKAIKGSRHVIWEMDVYPELAIQLGMLHPDAWSTRLLQILAGHARKRADGVIALGPCMSRHLVSQGISADRISVAENWADGRLFQPPASKDWDGRLTIIYPGNLGMGHDIETLMNAVRILRDRDNVRFQFVGGGKGFNDLKDLCRSLDTDICEFLPYEDPAKLAELRLSRGHVGLVSQKANCHGLLVPSKVYPLLASGLPFIFVGPAGATPNAIIEEHECGWRVANGDADSLVAILIRLANRRDELRAAAKNAREAFLKEYDRSIGSRRVCSAITEVIRPLKSVSTKQLLSEQQ